MGDVSRAAAADPEEPPPEDDATWTREFFHEENITENRVMRCVHENNFYVVPLNKNFIKIKD